MCAHTISRLAARGRGFRATRTWPRRGTPHCWEGTPSEVPDVNAPGESSPHAASARLADGWWARREGASRKLSAARACAAVAASSRPGEQRRNIVAGRDETPKAW